MWKRDEAVKPAPPREVPAVPAPDPAPVSGFSATGVRPEVRDRSQNERDVVNIGKSVVIKGELNGSEDLTIEGQVEGKIELREHVLTIGANGRIKAQVFAKSVIVFGEVTGNVTASDKVDIRENGSVDGDVIAPRVAIAEGAHFRGSVDMQRMAKGAAATSGVTVVAKPAGNGAADPKSVPQMPVTPATQPRVGA